MPARSCECGECRKCKHRAYMAEWYRRPGNADRVRGYVKNYRQRVPDPRRGFRQYDPVKTAARRKVKHEIAMGRLVREPCEVCGAEKVHAHHDDYTKPLEVRWLCSSCHGRQHRQIPS